MKIRVIYFCPRCGHQTFRPSVSRVRKDPFLNLLGVNPYRCHMCRVRFYLFRPPILRTLAKDKGEAATGQIGSLETPLA